MLPPMAILILLGLAAFWPGGRSVQAPQAESRMDAPAAEPIMGAGYYDSADTAVVMHVDAQQGQIQLWNWTLGKSYTLGTEMASAYLDRFGEPVFLATIEPGMVVDVLFLKSHKRLHQLQISPQAWVWQSADRYELQKTAQRLELAGQEYKLGAKTRYFYGGAPLALGDLAQGDVLSVWGLGQEVYSVVVEEGKGFLRLSGTQDFVGGWLEIGDSHIYAIEQGMALTLPEGAYKVAIRKGSGGGLRDVVINRGEETLLDIGDMEVPKPELGTVIFHLEPAEGELYIDGEPAAAGEPLELEYGRHQVIAKAQGYASQTQYVHVGEPMAVLDIQLEPMDSQAAKTAAGGASSAAAASATETQSSTAAASHLITVEEPRGAQLYVDGVLVGDIPCSFPKQAGRRHLLLSRQGYSSQVYTIDVDDEDKDVNYVFAELKLLGQ